MKLSERLDQAMKYAGLNQPQLEVRSGVKQQIIHKILKEKQLTSAHVVKLAMACGVRSEWLSEEQGDMVDGFYLEDPRLKAALNDPKRVNALLLMESLPEYAVDHVIKEIVETQELIDQAGQSKGAAA